MKALRVALILVVTLTGCFPEEPNNYHDTPAPLTLQVFPFFLTLVRGDSITALAEVTRVGGSASGGVFVATSPSSALIAKILSTSNLADKTTGVVAFVSNQSTPLGPYNVIVEASATGFAKASTTVGVNVVAASIVRKDTNP